MIELGYPDKNLELTKEEKKELSTLLNGKEWGVVIKIILHLQRGNMDVLRRNHLDSAYRTGKLDGVIELFNLIYKLGSVEMKRLSIEDFIPSPSETDLIYRRS